jgi:hypothetical protein
VKPNRGHDERQFDENCPERKYAPHEDCDDISGIPFLGRDRPGDEVRLGGYFWRLGGLAGKEMGEREERKDREERKEKVEGGGVEGGGRGYLFAVGKTTSQVTQGHGDTRPKCKQGKHRRCRKSPRRTFCRQKHVQKKANSKNSPRETQRR